MCTIMGYLGEDLPREQFSAYRSGPGTGDPTTAGGGDSRRASGL